MLGCLLFVRFYWSFLTCLYCDFVPGFPLNWIRNKFSFDLQVFYCSREARKYVCSHCDRQCTCVCARLPEGCSKRFHSLAMSQRSWLLSQDANKNSGVCSGCRTVRQLHLHRHGPRDNPCPGSNKLPLSVSSNLPAQHCSTITSVTTTVAAVKCVDSVSVCIHFQPDYR